MQLTFALAGLYLKVELGYTGRQVRQVHAALARRRPAWPLVEPPTLRGTMTVEDVLAAPAGPPRDATIDAWCAAVWTAFAPCRQIVIDFLKDNGVV